jgi:hypothetical protein
MPAEHDAHLAHRLKARRARVDQLADEPGQQLLQARLAARQQRVRVRALRHAPAALDPGWQPVALNHRDALVSVRQYSRGQQARHARADHDCVLSDPLHLRPPLVR